MRLSAKQTATTLIPLAILGLLGLVLAYSEWAQQKKDFAAEVQSDVGRIAEQADQYFYLVAKVADELAHRQQNLEATVVMLQESS